jgi:hypothetical protein
MFPSSKMKKKTCQREEEEIKSKHGNMNSSESECDEKWSLQATFKKQRQKTLKIS